MLGLPFKISRRYFFSGSNPSVVNIITGISVMGYAVGAAGLVILMSALNGFETAIFSSYELTDPTWVLRPIEGKSKLVSNDELGELGSARKKATFILRDKAILKYGDQQTACEVVGVDSGIYRLWNMDTIVSEGEARMYDPVRAEQNYISDFAWLGEGLIYRLGVGTIDAPISLISMDRGSSVMSAQAYNEVAFIPSAMLRLPEEESQKQVYIRLEAAQELFQNESISEVFFGSLSEEEIKQVGLFGRARGMELVSGREMHSMLYRMFNSEKWISFAILSFVLLLITFNLIGALSLLVIEKQRDFRLFYRLGMGEYVIQFLVFMEGLMVAFAGTILGVLLGVGLVLLQDRYGWVKTESTFTMAYPVELRVEDLGWISLLTFVLGGLSAILPSIRAKKIATTNIILDK